jgi:hypothetical protein
MVDPSTTTRTLGAKTETDIARCHIVVSNVETP